MSEKAPPRNPLGDLLNLSPRSATVVKFLAVGVALGVLMMNADTLFGLGGGSGRRPTNATEVTAPARDYSSTELRQLEKEMESDLAAKLALIDGAGRVEVTVTLKSGTRNVPVTNVQTQETKTGEKATDDSIRESTTTTRNETNVMVQDGNSQALAVMQRIRPEIAGVQVTAEGAKDPVIKERLMRAVAVGLGIPFHRITVESRTGEGR